jgi:hypothetical protein
MEQGFSQNIPARESPPRACERSRVAEFTTQT